MKYEYELTRDDYIEFNLFHIYNSKTNIKSLRFIRFAPPILFLIIPFVFRLYSELDLAFGVSLVVFVAIALLWLILFPKKYKKRLIKSVTKMLDEGKNDGFLGVRTFEISDEGIFQVRSSGESKNNWSIVERLAITDDYIYIYTASIMAYIVPTRVFGNDQEKEAFLDIIRTNMPSNN